MVLGKMPPVKKPPGKMSPGKLPPPENCPQENCPPEKFFVNFFLSLVFIFMRIFVHKKNLFSFNYFFNYKFIYCICLHYFFLNVYF